jgi:hypothetical protein
MFGSHPMIFFVRGTQCALALFFLVFMFDEHSISSWLGLSITLLVVETYMFGLVQAALNEEGLVYRRWKTWKQVQWAGMAYGGPAPMGFISVKLIGTPIWRRYLLLRAPHPPLEDQEASLPGASRFCEVIQPANGRTN